MIPRSFEYHDPESLQETLALVAEHGDEAKLMAGGMSLLPMMKLRLASPAHIVDLWRVSDMAYIKDAGRHLAIGGKTTHHTLATSTLLRDACPILAEAASVVGDPQIRNLGTIGGSLAHADPAADYLPVMVALGAEFTLKSKDGERKITAKDFFMDLLTTALRPTEVLTEVRVPRLQNGIGSAYLKLSRRATDFALVGVAVIGRLSKGGTCAGLDVVLGGMGPIPVRARGVEEALKGNRPQAKQLDDASQQAPDGLTPPSDVHADAAYRTEVSKVYVRRALERAFARAQSKEAGR